MDQLIKKVNSGERLNFEEAERLFDSMVQGRLTEAQIASSLIALRFREETENELAALVTILNRYKRCFGCGSRNAIDTCGTGGDGKSTVNVSTAASIILASMGFPVVKHGNTAQSGAVGSADILQALGMDLAYSGSSPEEHFKKHNFVFMLAPHYHPSLKGIGKVRRELKVPTIFNLVGPLVNPADPEFQVIGINRHDRLEFIARTMITIGRSNIAVYSSRDGYDEVSSRDKTDCILIADGRTENFIIDPSDFFMPFDMPVVKSVDEAKKFFVEGLSGENEEITDIFSLNTALALKTMNKAQIKEGYGLVKNHIASGKAKKKLEEIIGK
ncbi:MAG: anthranilate phosphoribosyltransferase [Spirochaetes bacterium RBG_16_49_21]|nr:MAG: anthranilate phosphoribosyltransferase [Spirochaetes bacterium RBG_16_49_21]